MADGEALYRVRSYRKLLANSSYKKLERRRCWDEAKGEEERKRGIAESRRRRRSGLDRL